MSVEESFSTPTGDSATYQLRMGQLQMHGRLLEVIKAGTAMPPCAVALAHTHNAAEPPTHSRFLL